MIRIGLSTFKRVKTLDWTDYSLFKLHRKIHGMCTSRFQSVSKQAIGVKVLLTKSMDMVEIFMQYAMDAKSKTKKARHLTNLELRIAG